MYSSSLRLALAVLASTVALAAQAAPLPARADAGGFDSLRGMNLVEVGQLLGDEGYEAEVVTNTRSAVRYYEKERANDATALDCQRNRDVVELQVNPDTQEVVGTAYRIQRTACSVRL